MIGPGLAQEWTPFAGRGVQVDISAGSAAEARDRALAQGQLLAFNKMLRSLTASEDHGRLPAVDPVTVSNMAVGFEVQSEKTSNVRYVATLTYRFDPESVRNLLQNYGIPFAESRGRPMVVVPVLQAGGDARLWDEENPWRDAWSAQAKASGLVPLVLPIGDLVDISKVNASQALGGDSDALGALAERYQTTDALVVVATRDEASGKVEASAIRYGLDGRAPVARTAAAASSGEPFAVAAAAIGAQLERDWKRQNLIRADIRGRLNVLVPVRNLTEWMLVRRRLDAIGSIRKMTLARLQRGQAQVDLDFVGTIDQLRRAFAQHDLDLRESPPSWVLSFRGGSALPSAPVSPDGEPINAPAPVTTGTAPTSTIPSSSTQ